MKLLLFVGYRRNNIKYIVSYHLEEQFRKLFLNIDFFCVSCFLKKKLLLQHILINNRKKIQVFILKVIKIKHFNTIV